MTDSLWSGVFGDAYTKRCADAGDLRGSFWDSLIKRRGITSALEVGCNVGANLEHIERHIPCAGLDVNALALSHAATRLKDSTALYEMAATEMQFQSRSYDLVFSSGVLIHIAPDDLGKVLDGMYHATSRWLLTIEYEALFEQEVTYRGLPGALWKRPYGAIVSGRFPGLVLSEQGPLLRGDGWDDCVYRLWRKV